MHASRRTQIMMATLVLIPVSLSCGRLPRATTPTDMPLPPSAAATLAPSPPPTSPPEPTATAEPTPAPLGSRVTHGTLEITVLAAVGRPTMYIGDVQKRHYVYYTAPAGKRIVDIAVLVHNTGPGGPVRVKWSDVGIFESNGDGWFPLWAKVKTVAGASISDPYSIGISSDEIQGDAYVEFADYTYLRLVFLVAGDPTQTIRFGIQDSPPIAFRVK